MIWNHSIIPPARKHTHNVWKTDFDFSNASGNNSILAVSEASVGGSQTAGLRASGYTSSPSQATNTSAEYDGTSWTTSNNLNTTRRTANTGAGSSAAGICANGYIADFSNVTELYEKPLLNFVGN